MKTTPPERKDYGSGNNSCKKIILIFYRNNYFSMSDSA
jgi:hypothetical protein